MKVVLSPTQARLSGPISPALWARVLAALTYSRSTYQWIPDQRRKGWLSEPVALYAIEAGGLDFPAGLWHRVEPLILPHLTGPPPQAPKLALPFFARMDEDQAAGLTSLYPAPTFANGTALYPDQEEALRAAVYAQRGLLALATNFGKTELMAAILAAWPDRPGIVLLDKKTLVLQTANRLCDLLGEPIRIFGGGLRSRWTARVTVATVQTLYRQRGTDMVHRLLAECEILLADEVHNVSATWLEVLRRTEAPVRLGLSGTIEEVKHPLPMEAYFGPVIHTVADPELIQAGRSAATTVLMPYIGHQIPLTWEDDADILYDRCIAENGARNGVLADFAVACARAQMATLVYFYRLHHGQALWRLIQARAPSLPTVCLDGSSSPPAVQRALRAAANGIPGVYLLGTGFTQGVDLPGVRAMVNAAGWRSPLATSQRGGRQLRIKKDGRGQWAYIIDPMDLGQPTLKNQAVERQQTYEKKGFQVQLGTSEDLLKDLGKGLTI